MRPTTADHIAYLSVGAFIWFTGFAVGMVLDHFTRWIGVRPPWP